MCPALPGKQTVVRQLLESILGYVRDTGAGLMEKGSGSFSSLVSNGTLISIGK